MIQELIDRINESIKDDDKEQYFIERTNKHIGLVQKAIDKIVTGLEWKEFDENELIARGKVHDASKFEEPERTPYVELTWRKFVKNNEVDPNANKATLHHITTNAHHPEYSLKDKSEANISTDDRDKSDMVIDATNMKPIDIAEMVADWHAMSEELGTNTAREWYNKQRDVRWHFSDEQNKLIDRILKRLENSEEQQ